MLSTESLKRIDREIAKYPIDKKQSADMSALAIAQEEKGWLASETPDRQHRLAFARRPALQVRHRHG